MCVFLISESSFSAQERWVLASGHGFARWRTSRYAILHTMEVRVAPVVPVLLVAVMVIRAVFDRARDFCARYDSRCLQWGSNMVTWLMSIATLLVLLAVSLTGLVASFRASRVCRCLKIERSYLRAEQLRVLQLLIFDSHGAVLDWERYIRWVVHVRRLILGGCDFAWGTVLSVILISLLATTAHYLIL